MPPPPPPQYVMHPHLQSTCHYTVNQYVKIWHVRLGVQIICAPLRWGGGVSQTERIRLTYNKPLYSLINSIIKSISQILKTNLKVLFCLLKCLKSKHFAVGSLKVTPEGVESLVCEFEPVNVVLPQLLRNSKTRNPKTKHPGLLFLETIFKTIYGSIDEEHRFRV